MLPNMSLFRHTARLVITIVLTFISALYLPAQDERFGIVERTGQSLPADVVLLSEDSVWVRLGDIIRKPTLLSFVYYRCPGLCSPVMDGLAEIIDKSDLKLGKDYQVITISIDYREPISLARAKKASYLKTMHTASAARFWQYYVTDSQTVKKITDAAGWKFKRNGNDFIHAAGTVLITPKLKISQYFYGTFILPMHFHLAVNDARLELADASRLKDQKYCYNFTPSKNRLYQIVVLTAGISLLVLAAVLFIWLSLSGSTSTNPQHSQKHGPLQVR
jgi:protein SCO1